MAKSSAKRKLDVESVNEKRVVDVDDKLTVTTTTLTKRLRTNGNAVNAGETEGGHESWTEEQVARQLDIFGLPEEGRIFKEEKITGRLLSLITYERLQEMGIRPMAQRLKVLEFLNGLNGKPQGSHCLSVDAKVFNDPIHGHIELHPLCIRVIDTPQFQRLRNIKQLGACYLVFPGGSHNRFEHSIGVCYLAGEITRAFQNRQPELGITEVDILCVQIAGLCHDLGHGPFSHLFDQAFIPEVNPGCEWKHEQASVAMLEYLIEDNGLEEVFQSYGLQDRDVLFIKELINGPSGKAKDGQKQSFKGKGRGKEKGFLYEIVANKRNGIDVDKWDYFARDCHGLGISNNFDHNRFIKFARVLDVDGELQICSKDKEAGNLYDMFHTRQTLHRRAYQHSVNKVIESMITEALVKANDHIKFQGKGRKLLKMSEAIYDMTAYSKVTDFVLQQILISEDPKLRDSQEILRKIQKRELYKCVGQSQPKPGKVIKQEEIPQIVDELIAILKSSENDGIIVRKEDLHVHVVNLDYGMKNDNPIDHVRFYSKRNPDLAVRVRKDQVSRMLPETFSEQIVRLHLKAHDDDDVLRKVRLCFQKWCDLPENDMKKAKMGKEPVEMTPLMSSQGSTAEQVTPMKIEEEEDLSSGDLYYHST